AQSLQTRRERPRRGNPAQAATSRRRRYPGAFSFAATLAGFLVATLPMLELLTVSAASLLSGFVDALVGGGGLILVPALFGTFPQAAPATLFGTNKGAAVWGTALATVQFARRVTMNWRALVPATLAALAGAALGAWAVTQVDGSGLRKALPF